MNFLVILNWVLRSEKYLDEWILDEMRNELKKELALNLGDEVLSGPGKPVMKILLESSTTLKEAAVKIFRWTWDKFLDKEVCFNHQPLINNRLVVKNTKILIKKDDVPEVDFGPYLDFETLREVEENIKLLDEDNAKQNAELTANLLRLLKRTVPLPENVVCDCRSKMRSFMDENKSFKNFKTFLKSNIIKVGDQTVNRLSASTFLYKDININFAALRKQLKAANPRQNCLLNDRLILLRQKIKFRIFYAKYDLYRMNLPEIKDTICEYCKDMESTSKDESIRHLLTECKKLNELWSFFRNEIKDKWNEEWSNLEMVYGPSTKSPEKLKIEYVFLRLINRFTGLRSDGKFNTDVVTPLMKTCRELINRINEVFDAKFGIEMDRTTMQIGSFLNTKT